jgi:membrane-associated protein
VLTAFVSTLLSLDQSVAQWVSLYGPWAIAIVATIVFAETGFVVLPFLPGDSLLFLFAAIFSAAGQSIHPAVPVIVVAAVLGDAANFAAGKFFAPRIIRRMRGRLLKQAHIDTTQAYFEKYGASTIVIARFVPIIRSLAPFLAGAGHMAYGRFAIYNIAGAVLWVAGLLYAGAWLGATPFVRDHVSAITLGIAVVSAIPAVLTWLRTRKSARPVPSESAS